LVAPKGIIDFSVCGTPEYMAPERLSDKRGTVAINESIDLWALGVLAFELFMGYTPYEFDG
jgi:serine/threonine protein kinase